MQVRPEWPELRGKTKHGGWRITYFLEIPQVPKQKGEAWQIWQIIWFWFLCFVLLTGWTCAFEGDEKKLRGKQFPSAQLDSFYCPGLAYLIFTGTTTYRTSTAAAKSNLEFHPAWHIQIPYRQNTSPALSYYSNAGINRREGKKT